MFEVPREEGSKIRDEEEDSRISDILGFLPHMLVENGRHLIGSEKKSAK
jgi:hypothetical protein